MEYRNLYIYVEAIYIQALRMHLLSDKREDLGASQERKP
jgi:hypothetical protein